jgi:hypothetical protein
VIAELDEAEITKELKKMRKGTEAALQTAVASKGRREKKEDESDVHFAAALKKKKQ